MFLLQHLDRKFLVERKFLSVFGAAAIVALISIGAIAQVPIEQSRPQGPSFEVASVRIHDPNDNKDRDNYQAYRGGRFTSSNASLWMLIHYAFQLQPYQITGIPGWIKSEHYDVDAKPAEAHPNFDDIPLMLQGVLEDRFQAQIPLGDKGTDSLRPRGHEARKAPRVDSQGRLPSTPVKS
jgi:hypothetical protein